MGFYGPISTHHLSATASFRYTGLGKTVGVLAITAQGDTQNFTTGITLKQDGEDNGVPVFRLMGWSGPIGQGSSAFHAEGGFDWSSQPPSVIKVVSVNEGVSVTVNIIVAGAADATAQASGDTTASADDVTGTGSSLKLDYGAAYAAALEEIIPKLNAPLLGSYVIEVRSQTLTYMGMVMGANTFKLSVTLGAARQSG